MYPPANPLNPSRLAPTVSPTFPDYDPGEIQPGVFTREERAGGFDPDTAYMQQLQGRLNDDEVTRIAETAPDRRITDPRGANAILAGAAGKSAQSSEAMQKVQDLIQGMISAFRGSEGRELNFPDKTSFALFRASSIEAHITTPLPAASPSALITIGISLFFIKLDASSKLLKTPNFAVGILFSLHKFFINALDPSSCEVNLFGPNTLIFFLSR